MLLILTAVWTIAWSTIGKTLLCIALIALAIALIMLLDLLQHSTRAQIAQRQALRDLREAEFLLRGATANLSNVRQALLEAHNIRDKRFVEYAEYLEEFGVYEECATKHGSSWPYLTKSLAEMRTYLESLGPIDMPTEEMLEKLAEYLEKADFAADFEKGVQKEDAELAEAA